MNIGRIFGIGLCSALCGIAPERKMHEKNYDYDVTNIDVCNERNRAWLCDEVPNWDKFEKEKHIDLNKQYLCSDQED